MRALKAHARERVADLEAQLAVGTKALATKDATLTETRSMLMLRLEVSLCFINVTVTFSTNAANNLTLAPLILYN